MPLSPSLYQINTRVWLTERSRSLGRTATLDDVTDADIERVARLGFDWFWLLGVWQTGPVDREVSLQQPQWRAEYAHTLPGFTDDDVSGSPFAVQEYRVDRRLGGPEALARLRQRLQEQGLNLMLDFVPNHTAIDHPWAHSHPEYYLQGNEGDIHREPQNYIRRKTARGPVIFAYGRDPYFDGWPDTLQLNYRHAGMRSARIAELQSIAEQCDGVRCDMAMLLLPEIFRRTWGDRSVPTDGTPPVDSSFWTEVIPLVRRAHADFLFLAEVYWDLEWALQQQGFDYTYDKRLYDRLRSLDATAVRGHLQAAPDFRDRSARFLENHDEPRAAAVFPLEVHRAAAVITFLVPGLRFIHEGQLTGRKVHVSMHLNRRPDEAPDPAVAEFYQRLLPCLRLPVARSGDWQLLDCRAAWADNPTWSKFIAFAWKGEGDTCLFVVVNYGATPGQCYVTIPLAKTNARQFSFRDRLSESRYDRDGNDLAAHGLYLDLPAWGHHVFEVIGE